MNFNSQVLGWVVTILGTWACIAYTVWHLPVAGKMLYEDKMIRGGIFIFMVNIIVSTQFSMAGSDFGFRRIVNALCFCMIAVGLTILMVKFRKIKAPVLVIPSVGVLRSWSATEKENYMSTKAVYLTFAKAAATRALRTFFQSLIAALPTASILVGAFDWKAIVGALAASAGAAALSVLQSLAGGLPEADTVVEGSIIVQLGKPGRHAGPDVDTV